jgi:hypothetical protein
MVTRTTAVSTIQTGFVLFALFNYLPLYLFNEFPEGDEFVKQDIKNTEQ